MRDKIVKNLLNIEIKKEFYRLKEKINKKSVEEILNEELLSGSYGRCIKDFMVCGKRLVTLNDYLIVNNKGIFILNINKQEGIVSGRVENETWKILNKNNIKSFKNPTLELKEALKEVERFLDSKYIEKIITKTIFTRALDIEEDEIGITLNRFKEYMDSLDKVISDGEVSAIFDELEIINIKDVNIRRKRKKIKKNYEMNIIHEREVIEEVDRVKILNDMRLEIN